VYRCTSGDREMTPKMRTYNDDRWCRQKKRKMSILKLVIETRLAGASEQGTGPLLPPYTQARGLFYSRTCSRLESLSIAPVGFVSY
jgi:hypothetical protein